MLSPTSCPPNCSADTGPHEIEHGGDWFGRALLPETLQEKPGKVSVLGFAVFIGFFGGPACRNHYAVSGTLQSLERIEVDGPDCRSLPQHLGAGSAAETGIQQQ